ncbi:MAG: molecular chaperone TorD family protein [Planctomycetes bacterium]|nr:molecular chaperone TorD family protein [Planctomycetota bacterium]MCB9905929.1 molecular chaperone TorD family protein [Planctomycetota bacterium]
MHAIDVPTAEPDMARLAARELVLRFLALAASDPASQRFDKLFDPGFQELAAAAAEHLANDPATRPAELAPGEAAPEALDLCPLIAALEAPRERLQDDHTRVFGLVVSKHCPPYEVQYCPQTFSIYRSQRMADVAGYYRAFGVEPGRDVPERADHVACELEFLAWAAAKERHARAQPGAEWAERAAVCRDAQRDFVGEHLAWWIPAFARALWDRAQALAPPAPLHAAFAQALASLVPVERAVLGVDPPDELAEPRPDAEPEGDGCAGCGAAS